MSGRRPDFLIIGTMKSGTTSLFRWLGEHPSVWVPRTKEPHFFALDDVWARGLGWYEELFAGAPDDAIVGEASTSSTRLDLAERAATRIAATVPDARLVCVLREPIARLRSQYRHEVQRGRERAPLVEAVRRPGNEYVSRSRYHACLTPYLGRFTRGELCIVTLEDLLAGPGWAEVVEHLSLAPMPRPTSEHNVTSQKRGDTALMRWLRPAVRGRSAAGVPTPARRAAKALLTRGGARYRDRVADADAPLPEDVLEVIRRDAAALATALGRAGSLWP